jgi:hypothetical protein
MGVASPSPVLVLNFNNIKHRHQRYLSPVKDQRSHDHSSKFFGFFGPAAANRKSAGTVATRLLIACLELDGGRTMVPPVECSGSGHVARSLTIPRVAKLGALTPVAPGLHLAPSFSPRCQTCSHQQDVLHRSVHLLSYQCSSAWHQQNKCQAEVKSESKKSVLQS